MKENSNESAQRGGKSGKARFAAALSLVGVGAAVLVALLTYGGPIFPHVAGPIALIAVGTILLVSRRWGRAR